MGWRRGWGEGLEGLEGWEAGGWVVQGGHLRVRKGIQWVPPLCVRWLPASCSLLVSSHECILALTGGTPRSKF